MNFARVECVGGGFCESFIYKMLYSDQFFHSRKFLATIVCTAEKCVTGPPEMTSKLARPHDQCFVLSHNLTNDNHITNDSYG